MNAWARALAASIMVGASGCAGPATRAPTATGHAPDEPQWQDTLLPHPDLLIALHPAAIRDDRVYGPLIRRAFERTRLQGNTLKIRLLETIGDADEVIATLQVAPVLEERAGRRGRRFLGMLPTGDAVVVLRGVRADIDPLTLADTDGHPLWVEGPAGRVRELVHDDETGATEGSSLFELPGRTWIIAEGNGRAFARDALTHPVGRPAPSIHDDALIELQAYGPAIVARIPSLQLTGGLSAVGRGMDLAEVDVGPGDGQHVSGFLSYRSDDAAREAEQMLRRIQGAFSRVESENTRWIGEAVISRPVPSGRMVRVTARFPDKIIDSLTLPHP